MDRAAALIAIDWGTTSARAYRIDRDGNILGEREAPLGISKIASGGFPAALAALLGDWSSEPIPRLACGMVGSRQGWIEAPYHNCPASLDELARALVQTSDKAMQIVPGLLMSDAGGIPDVMRGEETQLLGAVETDEAVVAVLPGTHSKWARVERGTVVSFATWFTGELYAVLMAHSILGRMAGPSPENPGPAFDRGVDRGLASDGLTHDLFGARTLALTNALAPAEVGDWLSGLLIGAEIAAAERWSGRTGGLPGPLRIVGADSLSARYERALARAGLGHERSPANAAGRGLWRIARQASLI